MKLCFALIACGLVIAGSAQEPSVGNLTPAEALAAFETEPGLAVELVAAEPLVVDPVALAFDEHGRMFVAENRGYPTGNPDGEPAGRIALLEDLDHDGRMDRRSDFVTGLTFPNGVLPWRGGVIVTCAPDVYWFRDADGDGRAEIREWLLTGFATNASTQLRVNDPTLGPDGWVYLAGGLSGGTITSPRRTDQAPIDLGRGDLRFRPDTGEMALTDGKSQFGLAFDDAGHRFACYNRVQSQHAVLPSRLVARNPHVVSPGALENCPADLVQNTLLRGDGSASRIFPISGNITTADSHAGTYSAACAVHIGRGDGLPAEYLGRAWSCDPTGNLVRSDRLDPNGATFAARRVLDQTEALRSRDNWFRPCFLADGPDGALYLADMYREVIEHPEYLPEAIRHRTRFDGGKSQGRIWKLRRSGAPVPSFKQNLASASTQELVAALSSPNGWVRDTAFRLLIEQKPADATELLLTLAPQVKGLDSGLTQLPRHAENTPNDSAAAGRVMALNLLGQWVNWNEASFNADAKAAKSFAALDPKNGLAVLNAMIAGSLDPSPAVRETAFRFLAMLPGLSLSGEILKHWARDPNPRVRFQFALAMGNWDIDDALKALGAVALQDGSDRWTRTAILSGIAGREVEFLDRLMEDPEDLPSPVFMRELGRLLGLAGGARDFGQRHWTWVGGPGNEWKLAFWSGLAEGMRAADPTWDRARFAEVVGLPPERMRDLSALALVNLRETSRRTEARLSALAFMRELSLDSIQERGQILNLVFWEAPLELQLAAIRAVAAPGPLNSATDLLAAANWLRFSAALQTATLSSLLSHPENHSAVMAALESGAVPMNLLSPSQRDQLRKSKDTVVGNRAKNLFEQASSGDRQQAFEKAKGALILTPVPPNGHEIFRRLCASCHRLNREGIAVGPDLFDIRRQSKETILLHLMLPEQEIAPNFTAYECETRDGRILTGLIAAESPGSITLRQAQGVEESIPRSQIARLVASRLSLMPQELEKGLSLQDLADLLGYLRGEGN